MAKSIRSKWKRKCRAIKRERYGQKELERLKKTLGIQDGEKATDVHMEKLEDVANVTDAKSIQAAQDTVPITGDVDEMDVDTKGRTFSIKKLRDQNGTYPVWLHPRKIRKQSKKAKRRNKKSKSKQKS